MSESKAKVAAKLSAVMADLGPIEKRKADAGDSFIKFSFQHWTDVLAALSKALVKHKVVIVPEIIQHEQETVPTHANKVSTAHVVTMRFTVIDSESGESLTAEWVGEGRDVQDKGLQKAATSAMKYFVLKLFAIPDRDSADMDEAATEELTLSQVARGAGNGDAPKLTANEKAARAEAVAEELATVQTRVTKKVLTKEEAAAKEAVADYLESFGCETATDKAVALGKLLDRNIKTEPVKPREWPLLLDKAQGQVAAADQEAAS